MRQGACPPASTICINRAACCRRWPHRRHAVPSLEISKCAASPPFPPAHKRKPALLSDGAFCWATGGFAVGREEAAVAVSGLVGSPRAAGVSAPQPAPRAKCRLPRRGRGIGVGGRRAGGLDCLAPTRPACLPLPLVAPSRPLALGLFCGCLSVAGSTTDEAGAPKVPCDGWANCAVGQGGGGQRGARAGCWEGQAESAGDGEPDGAGGLARVSATHACMLGLQQDA